MEQVDPILLAEESLAECLPGYMTVAVAAKIIGVSTRCVYGYLENGKLPGVRVGNVLLVSATHARVYKRGAPGRVRTKTPLWHTPPLKNRQYATLIKLRVRAGKRALLEQKLQEIRGQNKHTIPGTAARYMMRDQHDPDEITIVLIWRGMCMPSEEQREASLSAFFADLDEALAWETAVRSEHQVLLHA